MRRWSGEKKHKYETTGVSVWVRSIMRFLMFDKHQHKIHRFCFAFAKVFSAIYLVRLEQLFRPRICCDWTSSAVWRRKKKRWVGEISSRNVARFPARERKRRRLEKVSSRSIRNRSSSFVCFQCSLHIALGYQRSLQDIFPTNFYDLQQSDFLSINPMFIDHNFFVLASHGVATQTSLAQP